MERSLGSFANHLPTRDFFYINTCKHAPGRKRGRCEGAAADAVPPALHASLPASCSPWADPPATSELGTAAARRAFGPAQRPTGRALGRRPGTSTPAARHGGTARRRAGLGRAGPLAIYSIAWPRRSRTQANTTQLHTVSMVRR